MARKKTQQKEELTNNEEQVVVDQVDEKDPWDGYLSESTEHPASDDSYFSEIGQQEMEPDTTNKEEETNKMEDTQDINAEATQPQVANQPAQGIGQVNMNDISRAAFVQLRQASAYPDKEVDDFTIREFKKANAHLKNVIRTQMAGDKFDLTASYTSLLCLLAMAHINEVDLNEYFKVNV